MKAKFRSHPPGVAVTQRPRTSVNADKAVLSLKAQAPKVEADSESAKAIDEAVNIYSGSMHRLAKK